MEFEKLVLASGSPYRQKLLAEAGLSVTVVKPEFDEAAVNCDDPRDLALKRALGKAMSVAAKENQALVIGADQVLSIQGKAFSKVSSLDEAERRLTMLAGRTHFLHSAICLVAAGVEPEVCRQGVYSAMMVVRALAGSEIKAYLAYDEWQGSVGCYQYEHKGAQLFSKVRGTQDCIIGLPLLPLFSWLRALGLNPLLKPAGPWSLQP